MDPHNVDHFTDEELFEIYEIYVRMWNDLRIRLQHYQVPKPITVSQRFEEAILAETPCKVVTLDCTVEGKVLSDRHSFRKLCVGSTAAAKRNNVFVTYGQLVSSLGLGELAILKIDVESFEFPLFAELREHSHALPEQISVEVHWFEGGISDPTPDLQSHWGRGDFGITDLALFFFHMANLGYGIVNQEINVFCPACSEFTLLRVEAPVLFGNAANSSRMAAT